MIIKYTNFSDGIHLIHFEEPAEKLGLEKFFVGNVLVECRMDKSPHQIVVDCDLALKAVFHCDRCTKEFDSDLKNHFQLSFIFTKSSGGADDFNVKYLSPEQDKIDISEDVFEYSELTVPMKILCSDDCKGLCPKCGTNLNESQCHCDLNINNDIWEPLKRLKFNNK